MNKVIMFLTMLGVCFLGGIVGKMLDPPAVKAEVLVQPPIVPTINFPNFGKINFTVDLESGKINVSEENNLEKIDINVVHPPAIMNPVKYVYQQEIVEVPIRTYPEIKFYPLVNKNIGFKLELPVPRLN